ncbi:MAG: hypothetical protein GYB15_22280 [Gammaproteobacteria bacterium]|uniref:Uncharacterized protein n=1 Tax=Vreelandella titanicae TaxID=664683 RepID=A0A558JD51_9GAMM|nr:hypothetical protein [Halomonas titanicae]MBR9906340.1 hypothetical protein [Gammaproteobacteria bacterium]TVU91576.1 hypothetical protein FQP89_00105 [Halomonas titanicae]
MTDLTPISYADTAHTSEKFLWPRSQLPCYSRRRRPALGGGITIGIAHRRLHRRRRDGEVGWLYTLCWYLYYLLTLWTLPGLDMATKVLRQKKLLPAEMVEWSKPLPKEQWANRSKELVMLSADIRHILQQDPDLPIEKVFAEAYRRQGMKG